MKIYDISQEVFGACVYPGDPTPERKQLCSMDSGEAYNLTAFSMCAHNGTHIDAPRHFIQDGAAIDEMSMDAFVGEAYVAEHLGTVSGEDASEILKRARSQSADAARRILIKGDAVVSLEAAEILAASGVLLLGNESQTVGPMDSPAAVHLALLSHGVALLEGVRLANVPEGKYLLCAAPLSLAGSDGSPCRALLIEL